MKNDGRTSKKNLFPRGIWTARTRGHHAHCQWPVGQLFEVYASKSESDAKALASSKPGAMCFATDTHRIVFNGVVYNLVEIINNLTDGSTNKALSAAQGKALKALVDALPTMEER